MIEIGVMIDAMIVGMTVLEEVILVEEVVVAVTAEMMIEMVAMIVIGVMIERGEMTVMTGVTMERDVHNDQGDSDAPDETRGIAREKARERENLMESTMLVTKDKSRYQNSLTHTP